VTTNRPSGLNAASLTIADVVIEEVYSQSERGKVKVPVMYFRETKKGLILTPTNQDKLSALFGDDVTACLGQRIIIEPHTMNVAGQTRTVARIVGKAPPPAGGLPPKPASTEQPASDQPTTS